MAFEELDGGAEAATAHAHDEIDGTTAAATLAVVEELRAADAQHGAGPLPAGRVGGILAVAELDGERFERAVAHLRGACAPGVVEGGHRRTSAQACSSCSAGSGEATPEPRCR